MDTFEISVIIFLFLIWGQNSELVRSLARKLTRLRRKLIAKLR